MTINRASWSPEDLAEYEALLADVVAASNATTERVDLFEARLGDALQAQRAWARDVERGCLRRGMAGELKSYQDRQRALVSHDGRVLNLPKVQSRRVRDEAGDVVYQRELIELWGWREILDKRAEDLRARRHYDDRIAYLDRLLALRELCPDSVSPKDAATRLGISLDDFLGEEVAS